MLFSFKLFSLNEVRFFVVNFLVDKKYIIDSARERETDSERRGQYQLITYRPLIKRSAKLNNIRSRYVHRPAVI